MLGSVAYTVDDLELYSLCRLCQEVVGVGFPMKQSPLPEHADDAACIGFVPRSSWGLCLSVLTIETSAISGTNEVELVEEMNN